MLPVKTLIAVVIAFALIGLASAHHDICAGQDGDEQIITEEETTTTEKDTRPPGTGGIKPPPTPEPTTETEQETRPPGTGGFKSPPIRGPSFVCNPRCGDYASTGNSNAFISDRCCIFIPCPGTVTNQKAYQAFRNANCETTTTTQVPITIVVGARKPPRTGGIKPAPTEEPTTTTEKDTRPPGTGGIKPARVSDFVCNPRCAGYASTNNKDAFISDSCCTFIPCPGTVSDQDAYAAYKSDNCPAITTT